jgi:hypothetical protein
MVEWPPVGNGPSPFHPERHKHAAALLDDVCHAARSNGGRPLSIAWLCADGLPCAPVRFTRHDKRDNSHHGHGRGSNRAGCRARDGWGRVQSNRLGVNRPGAATAEILRKYFRSHNIMLASRCG